MSLKRNRNLVRVIFGSALCAATAAVVFLLPTAASAQATNSWTDGTGKWEDSNNWSRVLAPSTNDLANLITNAGNKTVTIDATTVGSFSFTMTVSNVVVSAPLNNTNTLFLNNAGTNTPLQILGNVLTLDTNGALVVNNSAVVLTNGSAQLNVGYFGAGNTLTITNGGAVYSFFGVVGNANSSSNNAVLVTGSGSVWSNGSELVVGASGTGNSLVISNGGAVYTSDGALGYYSSNNTAVVADPGSVWDNAGSLTVGFTGTGNSLVISNSGAVYALYGALGYYSSNNTAVVTGAGSVWSNSLNLLIGNSGSGNQLTITNGGKVFNFDSAIGSCSGSSNMVVVTGVGSVWSNHQLAVGFCSSGGSNSLTIAAGAVVYSGRSGLGLDGDSANNTALITGTGSVWNATQLTVGHLGAGNLLTITNGGAVYSSLGSVGSENNNNMAVVTGAGSVWSNTADLLVGVISSSNRLTIANGGKVFSNTGTIGRDSAASNNVVVVTGTGSVWQNNADLIVGVSGASNQLTIAAHGIVDSGNGVIGSNSTANGNTVFVTGPGSLWNTTNLIVGVAGSDNLLSISNAAIVHVSGTFTVGSGPSITGNRIKIVDGGAIQVVQTVSVGGTNSGQATFQVSGGTTTLSSNLTAGSSVNSTGIITVADGGQLTVTNGVIGIGNTGTITSGNGVGQMIVSNGTLVESIIVVGNTTGTQCDLILADGGVISDGGCPSGTNCQIVINSLGFTQTNGTVQACASPLSLGLTGPSDCTVSGDSANDSFQYLYAGYSDVGTFTQAGGVVNVCAQLIVGHQGLDVASVIATGAVWVTGGQLTMNSGDCIVGNSGVGQMSISNGTVTAAKVTVGNSANPTSFGTLTLAGGTLTMTSLVLPNPHSRFIFAGGWLNALGITNSNSQVLTLGNGVSPLTLNLLGGISSVGAGLKIATNATLSGAGTITGTMVNYGLIASGNGVLNFAGSVTNYGTILTTGGGVIHFLGTAVNYGLILTNNSLQFGGINHGLLLDPTADVDGDGMNNLWEALAGTDPTNSVSYFHIQAIATVGSDVQVGWSAVGGKSYVVQVAPVSGGPYADLSAVITAPGTGESTTSYTDPGAANGPPRFYRIRLGP